MHHFLLENLFLAVSLDNCLLCCELSLLLVNHVSFSILIKTVANYQIYRTYTAAQLNVYSTV